MFCCHNRSAQNDGKVHFTEEGDGVDDDDDVNETENEEDDEEGNEKENEKDDEDNDLGDDDVNEIDNEEDSGLHWVKKTMKNRMVLMMLMSMKKRMVSLMLMSMQKRMVLERSKAATQRQQPLQLLCTLTH